MKSLLGMSYSELQELVAQHNLPKFTAKQLINWLYIKRVKTFDEMTNLSKATRQHDWGGQRRVSFEYIVFKGLNDTQRHVNELARQLGSLRCRVNLIRFHAVPGVELHSPSMDDMVRFRDRLNDKGIIATIRASRGQDIGAACGLLSTKEKTADEIRNE